MAFATMTTQEVYDKVVYHLMEQKERSVQSGLPAIRGAFGNKCPVGIFIDDDNYDALLENHDLTDISDFFLTKGNADLGKGLSVHDRVLRQLQDVHDNVAPRWWSKLLKKVARAERLSYRAVTYYEKNAF